MPEAKYSSTNIFLLDFVCVCVPTRTCEREITLYNPLYTVGGGEMRSGRLPSSTFNNTAHGAGRLKAGGWLSGGFPQLFPQNVSSSLPSWGTSQALRSLFARGGQQP